ncbi:MAG: flagellar hook-associated protein FlgL [Gammaproteobacteria bacterium]|nr:flagellar hook-associated protein FlgL [Gammaproteobacteria bacterium]
MRISTPLIFQQGVNAILEQQNLLAKVQQQLATGKRIMTPSDDPAGAARAGDLQRTLAQTEQYTRNSDVAKNRLSLEEQTLIGVGNVLQRLREITIQAANATQSNESRQLLAPEFLQRFDELIEFANTTDDGGNFLFSGYQSGTKPFSLSAGAVVYNGDQGQRMLRIGPSRQVADGEPGADIFQRIANGYGTVAVTQNAANTGAAILVSDDVTDLSAYVPDNYTVRFTSPTTYDVLDGGAAVIATGVYAEDNPIVFNGISVTFRGQPAVNDEFLIAPSSSKDVFSIVSDFAQALQTPINNDNENADFQNTVYDTLKNLDQAINHIIAARSEIGARLATIDEQQGINENYVISLTETLSGITDLDIADAISRLQIQQSALQAAQQAYIATQGLSLFDLLA